MTLRNTTVAGIIGITLIATTSGVAMGAQPQGLYSADRLLDASVYAQNQPQQKVGEIKDILFGNNMGIKSFVVQTESQFGLGGKAYVVQPSQIRVQTVQNNHTNNPQYRVTLSADKQQLSNYPVYSNSWWQKTQNRANNAWQHTKQSAASAWTQLKNTTSNIINGAQNTTGDATNNTTNTGQ